MGSSPTQSTIFLMRHQMHIEDSTGWQIGDKVRKRFGYAFPGIILGSFVTTDGKKKYVVECTAPGCEGLVHIHQGIELVKDE